jgi:hypothetical protein
MGILAGNEPDVTSSSKRQLNDGTWIRTLQIGQDPAGYTQLTINFIERVDGQPDECGDTPITVPPYQPVTINQNITYVNIEGDEITEEGDFTILAPVFIGGAIFAPITVDVGGVEFPINLSLETGNITLDFSRDFSDSPSPVVGPDPLPDEPEEDKPEEDELIYGLILYGTEIGDSRQSTTLVAQASAPTLHVPRISNVYFQVPIGDRFSWVGPISQQLQNQVIMVPSGLGAISYRIVPSTGWSVEEIRIGKPPCGCVSG